MNKRLIFQALKSDNETETRIMIINEFKYDDEIEVRQGNPEILLDFPTPIQICGFYSSLKCFRLLLSNGADLTKKDRKGRSLIHFVSAGGSIELLELLLENRYEMDVSDQDQNLGIHYAAMFGHYDTIAWFWANAFDLFGLNRFQESILHLSSRSGNLKLVKFLLSLEFDQNALSSFHRSVCRGSGRRMRRWDGRWLPRRR